MGCRCKEKKIKPSSGSTQNNISNETQQMTNIVNRLRKVMA